MSVTYCAECGDGLARATRIQQAGPICGGCARSLRARNEELQGENIWTQARIEVLYEKIKHLESALAVAKADAGAAQEVAAVSKCKFCEAEYLGAYPLCEDCATDEGAILYAAEERLAAWEPVMRWLYRPQEQVKDALTEAREIEALLAGIPPEHRPEVEP